MLRKLLVYIFVFTSLQAQAANVFACQMMGAAMINHCCCEGMQSPAAPQKPAAASAGNCCATLGVVAGDFGTSDSVQSAFKALQPDLQPAPVAVLSADALVPASKTSRVVRDGPPGSLLQPGTRTYLDTLRLRI